MEYSVQGGRGNPAARHGGSRYQGDLPAAGRPLQTVSVARATALLGHTIFRDEGVERRAVHEV